MAFPASTFATLRALQLVIADALDDIQRVFSQNSSPDLPSSPASQCSSPIYACSPDLEPSPATSPFPATPPTSFPPTPLSATFSCALRTHLHTDTSVPFVDYPSPDVPLVPNSPSEQLALHPDAAAAASKIVAACGQMSNIVHNPFSSLCDAIMSYNLAACMRLVEHLHVAEILREAEESKQHSSSSGKDHEVAAQPSGARRDASPEANGPASNASTRDTAPDSRGHILRAGLHVAEITNVIHSYVGIDYVDPNDLVHALRLLSTHHIFKETAPDTFALTRVASLLDSRKSVKAVFSDPGTKYDEAGGIPALVALTTDDIFKSAAYLTEALTGVQLPIQTSCSGPSSSTFAILPGTTTIPSTSGFIVNDPGPGPSTTRSSSVLTHIVYPEDEKTSLPLSSLLAPELLANDTLRSPEDRATISQPFATDPSASPPPDLRLVESSTQSEKEPLRSRTTAKPEKLPAFNLAFRTNAPFFEWLENGGKDPLGGTGKGACIRTTTRTGSVVGDDAQLEVVHKTSNRVPQKSFRLDRFSKAMIGTTLWEAPRAILSGFDWYSLPRGSTIVDVGGGIGSTTMTLARALNDPKPDPAKERDGAHDEGLLPTSATAAHHKSTIRHDSSLTERDNPRDDTTNALNLRFVVQDRPVVTALGIEAWRSKCPEFLDSGLVAFQDHDFFEPQPPFEPPHLTRHPAVYILRVVLHDWPDECARRILINLRVASNPDTRLLIAEHVLPLACPDEGVVVNTEACDKGNTEQWTLGSVLANVEGAESTLVPPPLLSNLGKASANAYWMDLLMHIMFSAKERTLREFCALALSAGWRVTRMTRPEGTSFAYLVCEPITLPDDAQAIHNAVVLSSELSTVVAVPYDEPVHDSLEVVTRHKRLPPRPVSLLPSPIFDRPSSRCGTPTFGSRILLPKDEELQSPKTRGPGAGKKWLKSKGLGARGVMIQKAEKRREGQQIAKGDSARDNDDIQNAARTSPSHMRVWWKKSPPSSTGNSSTAIHESSGEVLEHRAIGLGWRGTFKPSDSPSTSSPRVLPVHQKWSSTESAALPTSEATSPVSRVRRPSVAGITRKLSFATFGRRPSIADIGEPLPTPPHSATMTELAPSPNLRNDTGRGLKHLPSLPTLGRTIAVTDATAERPAIPRRPSFSFADQRPPLPSVLKPTLPRRVEIAGSAKPSVVKSRTSPYTSKQGSSDLEGASEPRSIAGRQRRVTLSNSLGTRLQGPAGVTVLPDPTGSEMKRIPSMPKLPRRLSIPMLRRKQSQSTFKTEEPRVR